MKPFEINFGNDIGLGRVSTLANENQGEIN